MPRKRIALVVSAIAVAALCVLIFWMSAKPADESDEMSLGLVASIIRFIVPGFEGMSPADQDFWLHALNHPVRKLAHFSEYALLGMLAANLAVRLHALRGTPSAADASGARGSGLPLEGGGADRGRRGHLAPFACAWAFSVLYAVSDEVHQLFVPGRACQFTDVCIDASGALLGVCLVAFAVFALRRARARRQARSA